MVGYIVQIATNARIRQYMQGYQLSQVEGTPANPTGSWNISRIVLMFIPPQAALAGGQGGGAAAAAAAAAIMPPPDVD